MMGNGLVLLLQQLIAPALQLRDDGFNVAGLLDGSGFEMRGITVTQLSVRQLCYGMSGVFIEALSKLLQHLNGRAQFGGRGCLHGQMRWLVSTGFGVRIAVIRMSTVDHESNVRRCM